MQTVTRLVITERMLYASSANFSPRQLRTELRRSPRPMASASKGDSRCRSVLLRDSSAEIFKDDALSRVFIPAMFVRGLPSCCSGSQQATKTSATCRGFAKRVENPLATTRQQIQQISAYFTHLKSFNAFLLPFFFLHSDVGRPSKKMQAARPGGETLFFSFFQRKKQISWNAAQNVAQPLFALMTIDLLLITPPSAGGILMNERNH